LVTYPRRRHHRAGDDRPDPRHAHQPLATGIPARGGSDLARQTFDPLIQPTPVADQILDEVNHALTAPQPVANAWQSATKKCRPCCTAFPRPRGKARI
jgi:hypothetical protein